MTILSKSDHLIVLTLMIVFKYPDIIGPDIPRGDNWGLFLTLDVNNNNISFRCIFIEINWSFSGALTK